MTGMQRGREIDEMLREARSFEPAAPAFDRLWAAARATGAAAGPRRPRVVWAAAAALLVIAAGSLLLVRGLPVGSSRPAEPPSVEVLAASLSSMETPLDSLLDLPGGEIYATLPSLTSDWSELPADGAERRKDS